MVVSESLAEVVAERAHAAAGQPDSAQLSVHLLLNMIAAIGRENVSNAVRSVVRGDASPGAEAFRFAAMMHARTQDDNYAAGRSHIGTLVIPAILACGASDPMPAMAAGYESGQAVSSIYSSRAQQLGMRPTPVFGAFAAAAAASICLGHDVARTASTLSLVAATVGGTNQAWLDGADEWLFQVSHATRSGVEAALLASRGVSGSRYAFEGKSGLSRLFGDPGGEAMRLALSGPLMSPRDVENKPFPIGGVALAASLLAAQLGEATGRKTPTRLTVHLPSAKAAYPGAMNNGPFQGRADSLMSVSRCVGLGYLFGSIPFEATAGQPSGEEQKLLDVTEVVPDAGLSDGAARVSVLIGEQVESLEGECTELLYPSWGHVVDDLATISDRYEATPDACVELCALVARQASSQELAAVVRSAKPERDFASMEVAQ